MFVGPAIRNILGFCDKVFVADHESQDHTWEIVRQIALQHPQVEPVKVRAPGESHSLIEGFAGSRTWVFGVDGDEIYDPAGLAMLRGKILEGVFDDWWQVFGNVLNCKGIDFGSMTAEGFMAPPCRSITKLFNFSAIESWSGCSTERLHGGSIVFRPGYDGKTRLNLQRTIPWENAELRCLHTCFMRRSSLDDGNPGVRMNIVEKNQQAQQPLLSKLLRLAGPGARNDSYKREKYMRGPLVKSDVRAFFAEAPAARVSRD